MSKFRRLAIKLGLRPPDYDAMYRRMTKNQLQTVAKSLKMKGWEKLGKVALFNAVKAGRKAKYEATQVAKE